MIFKRISMLIGLALLTISLVSCSDEPAAPDPEKEAHRRVTMNDVAGEPPMTEDDILLYIKILPEFAPIEDADPAGEMEFYKKYNFTKNRFYYLRSKIANASLIVVGRPPDLSGLPESVHPSDEELEVVKKNFQAIKAATDEFNDISRNR